jgi:hypothetical protein
MNKTILELKQEIDDLKRRVSELEERAPQKRFVKPTREEVEAYMVEYGLVGTPAFIQGESHKFINHYTSNGWKVGKTAMKDWKAAVRNWVTNIKERAYTNGKDNSRNFGNKSLFESGNNQGGFGSIPTR